MFTDAKKRVVESSLFAFNEFMTLVSYIPKKDRRVILLSTSHHEDKIINENKKKPEIIISYNKFKGKHFKT